LGGALKDDGRTHVSCERHLIVTHSNAVPFAEGVVRNRVSETEMRVNRDDFPAPEDGFVVTHFLVVSDQDRSREFYRSLFDGKVVKSATR
jgi:hypothetical protein